MDRQNRFIVNITILADEILYYVLIHYIKYIRNGIMG